MIESFRGDYRFLSNFYPRSFVDKKGIEWATVEHYYQASKTDNIIWFRKIQLASSPFKAKKWGQECPVKETWDTEKELVMYYAVTEKFKQNEDIRIKLLETGDEEIEEGNDWGDVTWGTVDGEGQNLLGKILMRVRKELKELT